MPIILDEIKFLKSTNGLGGEITGVEVTNVLHDVFDLIGSAEAAAGDISYRCIYVRNLNPTLAFQDVLAYITVNTIEATTEAFIGVGTAPPGSVETPIATELDAPAGVTFYSADGVDNGLLMGDIPADSYKAFWLKRVVNAGAPAISLDQFSIEVKGDSLA
jgi:hypothetical protein